MFEAQESLGRNQEAAPIRKVESIKVLSGKEILELPLNAEENDAGAATVREYLVTLLSVLWDEGESFSGKRPLGNSGWEYELLDPLEEYASSKQSADQMVQAAIEALL